MLTFLWNGWQGKLFPQSLAALAVKACTNNQAAASFSSIRQRIASNSARGDRDEDDDEGESEGGDTEESSDDEDRASSGTSGSVAEDHHIDSTGMENPYVYYTKRLGACMQRFSDMLAAYSRSNDDGVDPKYELLREPASAIANALVQQHLAGSPYDSPLLAYSAMLAVDTKYRAWEEPGSFNSHLSALIYCGQLWASRFSWDIVDRRERGEGEEEEGDDGLDEQLDHYMRRYFSNTVSKPLPYLLLWRRRLFGIAPVTMVNRPATWDLERKTVTHQGISVGMDQIRHLLQHTLTSARTSLYGRLMFGIHHIPKLTPTHLEENDTNRNIGWWFGKHAGNATLLNGHEHALVEHVANTPELRSLYMEERSDADGDARLAWRKSGIRYYRQCV